MSNTYRITKVSPCPECDGSRWLFNPAWEMYYENFGPSGAPTAEEQHTWFSENGYEQIPDEEEPCWVCEGTGQIVTETTLEEALEDIGTQRIHQHFDERLLDLESDIKAIPMLIDRVADINNGWNVNSPTLANLQREIRGLNAALFHEIQEFTTHIDAKMSREARSVEALEGFVSRISDRMNQELENVDHLITTTELVSNHVHTLENRIDNLETSLNQIQDGGK